MRNRQSVAGLTQEDAVDANRFRQRADSAGDRFLDLALGPARHAFDDEQASISLVVPGLLPAELEHRRDGRRFLQLDFTSEVPAILSRWNTTPSKQRT